MPLRIKNWDEFQHYQDRRPPWIKVYQKLLDDPEWHKLSGDEAKTLVMLWLIASEQEKGHRGQLPPVHKTAFRMRMPEEQLNALLPKLNHWIQGDLASTELASGYQLDTPERETETDFSSSSALDSLSSNGNLLQNFFKEFKPADAYDLWNAMLPAKQHCDKLTPTIKKKLETRLRERPDRRWWEAYFGRIRASDFLCGRVNGRDFVATLDWVLKPTNRDKIEQGNYNNRKAPDAYEQMMEAFRRGGKHG